MWAKHPKDMTKKERILWADAMELLEDIEWDLYDFFDRERKIPKGWHSIWQDRDRRDPNRVRVTISLDADVVKFFKAMGKGYQPRINRVLRAFVMGRLSGMIEGPEADIRLAEARKKIKDRWAERGTRDD